MTIKYIGEPPSDEGYYLVRADGKQLEVALFGESLGWLQIGNDYDAWSHSSATIEIEAIVKLDLDMIEQVAKQGYYFLAKVEPKPN
jgi:hypothetical protein